MRILFILFIGFLGIASRLDWIGDHPENFTPILSIVILSGFYIKSKLSFLFPLAILIITDLFIGYGPISYQTVLIIFGVYFSYLLIYLLGKFFLKDNFFRTMQISFWGSLIFFLITNFMVWLVGGYGYIFPESLITCYLYGIEFYRNTLISTLSFSAYFYIMFRFANNYYSIYSPSSSAS